MGLESELSETITALRKMTVDGEDVRRKLVVELEGRAIAEAQVPMTFFSPLDCHTFSDPLSTHLLGTQLGTMVVCPRTHGIETSF